ncbi:MAG: peptidoglycan-associated lipoprotein Pal [Gammaproteobacteria bacterium]|nr:peptidoglycan-associated lipoprotein Pal [Gammaproteobacteria bacterium]
MYKTVITWVFITLSVILFAGCTSTPDKGPADVTERSTGAVGEGTDMQSGAMTSAASQGAEWYGDPLEDPNSLLATRVIYFEFDQSSIGMEYRDIVRAHAEYLATHPQVLVRLEGHADERGTREYNLGLGESRANAVRSIMMAEGVSDEQIVVVSYGEERAASFEHNEEAWALNRRVELIY